MEGDGRGGKRHGYGNDQLTYRPRECFGRFEIVVEYAPPRASLVSDGIQPFFFSAPLSMNTGNADHHHIVALGGRWPKLLNVIVVVAKLYCESLQFCRSYMNRLEDASKALADQL